MVAVRLSPPFPFVVVGSPDYFRRRKKPERLSDLREQACLRMRRTNGAVASWSFQSGNKPVEAIVSGPLIANDFPTVLGAALEGLGLAQAPWPIAAAAVKSGKLVRVLEAFEPTVPGVFLYYPSRHQMMPKLRAFIDHVKSRSEAPRARSAKGR
jgi:DNA-binding transcriptional LysR family regulator